MKEHYVYIHLNPITNEIFYVGKGKGNRKSSKNSRNLKWTEYVSKLDEDFKVLVVKNNLSEIEALELERKIISKIDWHYDDLTTNVTNSFPDLTDAATIQIIFKDVDQTSMSEDYIPNMRFQKLSNEEIISTLLHFPNELELTRIASSFENICEYFYDNRDELEEIDEDIFYDIEIVLDTIEDLLTEYKSSDMDNIDEFIRDLKRERIEIEIIQEDKPKGKQRKFLKNLAEWIDIIVEK